MLRTAAQLPALPQAGEFPHTVPRALLDCQPTLLRHISRHLPPSLRSRCDPRDIVQAVYVQALQHFDHFDSYTPAALEALLTAMADDEVHTMLRRRHAAKRAPEINEQDVFATLATDKTMIGLLAGLAVDVCMTWQRAADSELRATLADAVDDLPERYRQAVRLRYIEQVDPKDAAARLGCSLSAFYKRCDRSIEELRHCLGPISRWQ
jgi:RNA polymerase sigma factor (sigma-70 family)